MQRPHEPKSPRWIWDDADRDDSWPSIVYWILAWLHGQAMLDWIYNLAEQHPRAQGHADVRRTVRRALRSPDFVYLGAGTWGIRSQCSRADIERSEARRSGYLQPGESP
jgi:hypothetical protein